MRISQFAVSDRPVGAMSMSKSHSQHLFDV